MQSMIRTLFNQALQMDTYLRGGVRQHKVYGDDGFMDYVEYAFDLASDHLLVREELCCERAPEIKVLLVTADGPAQLDEAAALVRIQDVFNDLFAKTRADVERRHRLATGAAQ